MKTFTIMITADTEALAWVGVSHFGDRELARSGPNLDIHELVDDLYRASRKTINKHRGVAPAATDKSAPVLKLVKG